MNLVRFHNPQYNANRVLVDELFNNLFNNDYHEDYVKNNVTKPATNIFETEKEFKIELLVPGVTKDDLSLVQKDNLLTIKVEKKEEEKQEEYKYARREFGAYQFRKAVPLT